MIWWAEIPNVDVLITVWAETDFSIVFGDL